MPMPRMPIVWVVLLAIGGWAGAALAAGPGAGYVGSFVGKAVDELVEAGKPEARDIDIVISPYKKDGLRIQWTNVTLVEGRRDVPGVKRRVSESLLVPADGKDFLVESPEQSPFRIKDEVDLMRGDAIRWAAFDENGMHVYSFVVLEDGRYELQTYTRRLTEEGLDLVFERTVEGKVVRRMTGKAVRAD
ncbi:MAG TPA: hypothetical protein VFG43_04090 [Geminicoccaceae bacterium]|nr:hypothetical protein [Geminicoccaceae bacterium]